MSEKDALSNWREINPEGGGDFHALKCPTLFALTSIAIGKAPVIALDHIVRNACKVVMREFEVMESPTSLPLPPRVKARCPQCFLGNGPSPASARTGYGAREPLHWWRNRDPGVEPNPSDVRRCR